jgi:hypothetical protein
LADISEIKVIFTGNAEDPLLWMAGAVDLSTLRALPGPFWGVGSLRQMREAWSEVVVFAAGFDTGLVHKIF